MADDMDLPADVIAALRANRKIEAIKLLREYGQFSLKEAKEIVDTHIEANPVDNPHIRVETGAGRLLLIGVAVAAAGIYWVTR